MARKEAVLALFEQRFDYYSARTVLGEALARAGLADQKNYDHAELDRLVQGLLMTGQGMLDRLIAGLRALEEAPAKAAGKEKAPAAEEKTPAAEEEAPSAAEETPAEAPEAEPEEDQKPKAKKKR
ncbi:hypothetical protein KBD49_10910 [Myxococcota bacterium]|nr:hypothetical protein [Myxococcota bacterium]